jgi:predicted acetyltransferase
MEMQLRSIRPEELDAFTRAQSVAFGRDFQPDSVAARRAFLECDRTVAAFDGPAVAGTAAAFRFDLSIPGGTVPCAAVTMVSVQPTHRRRGLLTAMMRRQMEQAREWNEPVAALWASESSIYGRFGYGEASAGLQWKIERVHAALREEIRPRGRVFLASVDEARVILPGLFDRLRPDQPGLMSRPVPWWEHRIFADPLHWRAGYTANGYAVYEEGGTPLGYARYRTKAGEEFGLPMGALQVADLMAVTPAAERGLWSYLFGVDLIATIEAVYRPMDEPLYWMLRDPRRLVRHQIDSLWVRLVDVPAALTARRYPVAGSLTFELVDDFCPWNAGRYELDAGPSGVTCKPTTKTAEIALSAESLGAVYLGGTGLGALAAAGRVEGERAAVAKADRIFAWERLPWCNEVF